MKETGWQAIGRIAKARRERLGLNQEDLADYGGPKVSTVGKFERAAQERFPLRTQHQMEKALGWSHTVIEQVVNSIDDGSLSAEDWEYDLVEEDIPDLSQPRRSVRPSPQLDFVFTHADRIHGIEAKYLSGQNADLEELDERARALEAQLVEAQRTAETAAFRAMQISAELQVVLELRARLIHGLGDASSITESSTTDARKSDPVAGSGGGGLRAARTVYSRGRAFRNQQDEEAAGSQEGPDDVEAAYGSQIIDVDDPTEPPEQASEPQRGGDRAR